MVSPVANRIYPARVSSWCSGLRVFSRPFMQGHAGNFDAVAGKGQLAVRSHKGREAYGGRDALGQQRALSELQLVPVRIAMSFKSLRPGSSDEPAEHLGG